MERRVGVSGFTITLANMVRSDLLLAGFVSLSFTTLGSGVWCWLVVLSPVLLRAATSASTLDSSVQFSSVRFSSAQLSSVQFSSVQPSSVQFSSVQCSSGQVSADQFNSVQFSSVQIR